MRLTLSSALCLSLLAPLAVAQQAATSSASTPPAQAVMDALARASVELLGNPSGACPVSMAAERQADGRHEWIVALEDGNWQPHTVRANKAGVHVQLDSTAERQMTEAEVAVYYMAPGIHALPLSTHTNGPVSPVNLSKTFILHATTADSARQLAGSLLVGPAASIMGVRLLSITYSDGTVWRSDRANSCSVTPGLLMAVAARESFRQTSSLN